MDSSILKLYLVTDDSLPVDKLGAIVKQAIAGGVTLVQLREKSSNSRLFLEKAQHLKQLLAYTGVPLIINDRVDIALAVEADGVHLGQSDMPVDIARALLGPEKIIGLSIETKEQLHEARAMDIDYVGLSAIYSTATKTNTITEWGVEGLTWALQESRFPIVAIGGLTEDTIPLIANTGVDGIAVVSAICSSQSPKKAATDLNTLIDSHRP
ncbi:thiamine phosphate synthase [Vibrio viridaestus]|uniref:Thiamine-phosphate synthase n=1 Tax=Vibrio viridaestus TaxID=2487322 RepID=A0A3N9TF00_9VIBR|nr:thiamine phosphate synthase [Vibrio viridaestus]RQW62015.1 thiamine phosphate synthase [Vibrio viridaestus]